MDPSDSKASEFERRLSRHVSRASRTVSFHARSSNMIETGDDVRPSSEVVDAAALARHASAVSSHYSLYNMGAAPRPSISSVRSVHSFHQSLSSTSFPSSIAPPVPVPTASKAEAQSESESESDADSEPASSLPTLTNIPSTATATSTATTSDASTSSSPSASPSSSPSAPVSPPDTAPTTQTPASFTPPAPGMVNRPSSIAKPPIVGPSAMAYRAMPGASDIGSGSGSGSGSNIPSASDQAAHAAMFGVSGSGQVPMAIQGEEPYQGPTGPSFPYQMYPQNVRLTRTMSNATASTTAPSESSYTGPRGPAFPYTMYPQNTVPMGAVAGPSTIQMSSIPVGFPGMGGAYQRRIGPDGEDIGDMIGPDGHTEQLPPYSRYPEDPYTRKMQAVAGASASDPLSTTAAAAVAGVPLAASALAASGSALAASDVASSSSQPGTVPVVAVPEPAVTAMHSTAPAALAPIPGAGGIGLAARNPEFDASDDLDSPQSRHSSRSFVSDGSRHEINAAAAGINEKTKKTKLQELARRRLWGIVPYWAICLMITALVLMGIILGAVVGTLFARRHKPPGSKSKNGSTTATSITVTVDATPISTPTNLTPLPTGVYGLPLQVHEAPDSCFNDTTQSQAWSCDIWYLSGLTVDVVADLLWTQERPLYNVSVNYNESQSLSNGVFWYGDQPPSIPELTPLQLVNDTVETNRGPAWFKMLMYNKTVILPESALTATATSAASSTQQASSKRSFRLRRDGPPPPGSLNRDGQLNRVGSMASSPNHRKAVAQAGDKPWVCTWPDTILELFIYPSQNTSTYKVSLSSSSSSSYVIASTTAASAATGSTAASSANAASSTTSTTTTASATSSADANMPAPPAPYPRVIKVEERRMANSPQPTCVQYELSLQGTGLTAVPSRDENGNQITITIVELESDSQAASAEVARRNVYDPSSIFRRSTGDLSNCGCAWMAT